MNRTRMNIVVVLAGCLLMVATPALHAQGKPTVGIIDFSIRGSATSDDAVGVAGTLAELLGSDARADFIAPQRVNTILKEMGFVQPDNCGIECIVKAGQLLQADIIIVGSLGKVGSMTNLSIQIINVRTAKIEAFKSVRSGGAFEQSDLRELASWIGDEIAKIPLVKSTTKAANELDSLHVGAKAPGFVLPDVVTHDLVRLRELTADRYVVVLNFWATWCKPCEIEIPYLDELARKFRGKKVKILLIETMDVKEFGDIKQVMKDRGYRLTSVFDGMEVHKRYKLRSLPTTIVIDQSGIIRKVSHGYHENFDRELESFVDGLLGGS